MNIIVLAQTPKIIEKYITIRDAALSWVPSLSWLLRSWPCQSQIWLSRVVLTLVALVESFF
jgi:hypothetical protein